MQDERSRSELEAELKRHRGLVQATALHYAKRCHEPLDDLTQEGWIGFLRAYQGSARLRDRPLGAYANPSSAARFFATSGTRASWCACHAQRRSGFRNSDA